MLIFQIASDLRKEQSLYEKHDIAVRYVRPSRFSFLTPMRIAAESKRGLPDAIFVYRPKDAVAALSARTLIGSDVSVTLWIDHNRNVPHTLHSRTAEQLEAVVFDSETTRRNWQSVKNIDKVRQQVVRPPFVETEICKPTFKGGDGPLTILYIGQIGKGESLGAFLDGLARNSDNQKIAVRVLGTARARYVMPIAKRAKANRLNVTWLGDEYDLQSEMFECDGFIQAAPVPDENEMRMLAIGKPVVEVDRLNHFIGEEGRREMSYNSLRKYIDEHSPEGYFAWLKHYLER